MIKLTVRVGGKDGFPATLTWDEGRYTWHGGGLFKPMLERLTAALSEVQALTLTLADWMRPKTPPEYLVDEISRSIPIVVLGVSRPPPGEPPDGMQI